MRPASAPPRRAPGSRCPCCCAATFLTPKTQWVPGYPSETFRVLKQNEIRRYGEYRTARLVLAAWDAHRCRKVSLTLNEDRMDKSLWRRTNACAALEPAYCETLAQAATKMLDANNIVIKVAEQLGGATSWIGGKLREVFKQQFGFDISEKIDAGVLGVVTGDVFPLERPGDIRDRTHDHGRGDRQIPDKTGQADEAASRAADQNQCLVQPFPPITRSIGMQTSHRAGLKAPQQVMQDGVEVFALGSPLADDNEVDLGYWTARAGLSHATVELFIKNVAAPHG